MRQRLRFSKRWHPILFGAWSALCLAGPLLHGPKAWAQSPTEDQKKAVAEEPVTSDFGGMPLLFRTPETGLAIGGVLLYTSGLDKKRPSPIISGLMYTEKKQILWGVGAREILDGEESSVYAYTEIARFPQTFFGTGRDTDRDDATAYEEERQSLEFGGDRELIPHLSVGGGLILRNDKFKTLESDGKGLLGHNLYHGENGGPQRGAQFYLLWESTNDNYFPSQGMKIQLFSRHYFKQWGSRYPFSGQKLDARFYHMLGPNWIQAHQFFAQNVNHDPPFYQLAQLGGNDLLRGYYKGRYRDRKMIVMQTETRYRFSKYWNVAVFGGFGNVSHDWDAMPDQALKPSYGTGVRYQISPKQKINVRLDVGLGEDQGGPQLYLYVMEAW
ncbi:BamA/TamA family outer membrane protein [Oligoflexus tunisiensis]|uniref:BamA/TamA family outer membrane protein n=1 Tax=Oligoflexus tunisiensis TaxID=708132 RepID=UPI00159F3189|nr:BamA/TamA family outer membrane protein [Oligoflexus tunisiensis]